MKFIEQEIGKDGLKRLEIENGRYSSAAICFTNILRQCCSIRNESSETRKPSKENDLKRIEQLVANVVDNRLGQFQKNFVTDRAELCKTQNLER